MTLRKDSFELNFNYIMWLNVITWSNLEEIDGDLVRLISNRVQDLDLGKNFIFISEFSQSLSQHFLALTSFITLSQRVLICSRPFKNIQENSDANRLTSLSGCPSCPNSSARYDTNFDQFFRTFSTTLCPNSKKIPPNVL